MYTFSDKSIMKRTLLLLTSLTVFLCSLCEGVEFRILNQEIGNIWVGIQGNPGHAHLKSGGFVLAPQKLISLEAPANWSGRFWPRTWCFWRNNRCLTGDCRNGLLCNGTGPTPPATIVQITLGGGYGGVDHYEVSLEDGFNIEAAIEPIGGVGTANRYSCRKSYCPVRLNDQCPQELQIPNTEAPQLVAVIGCKSAKLDHNATCGTLDWRVKYFKDRCPEAFVSSICTDHTNYRYSCRAGAYQITFGG